MTQPKKENYELILYRLDVIDKKLDVMSKQYVTKEEFEAVREKDRALLAELDNKFELILRKNKVEKFLYTLATTIIVGLVSLLIHDLSK